MNLRHDNENLHKNSNNNQKQRQMKEMKKMFGIFAMAGIIICATFTTGCSDDSDDYYASGDFEYTLAEETFLREGENVVINSDTTYGSYDVCLNSVNHQVSFDATIDVRFYHANKKLRVELVSFTTDTPLCMVHSVYLTTHFHEGTYDLWASGQNEDGIRCSGKVDGKIFYDLIE